MTTTPLVTLQKPKDISLSEIEAELSQIWAGQDNGKSAPVAVRASTFSMVVYEPQEFQQLLAILGFYEGAIEGIHGPQTRAAIEAAQKAYGLRVTGSFNTETLNRLRQEVSKLPPEKFKIPNLDERGYGISEAIAIQNPCRIISLAPVLGEDQGVSAQVSAYCPIQKTGSDLVCCEYITLRGTKEALNRMGDVVVSLMIPDLPKFVWWKATPNVEQELFKRLAASSNCIIFDSSFFSDPESELIKMHQLIESGTYLADLNWHRLSVWQELAAAAFDPPERRVALAEVDQVTIDYEKGNPAQALTYLGWLASRLKWEPTSYHFTSGDYDITSITFVGPNGREIRAELAGIPIANPGEILGDLIGLRLTSTNLNANCCTILCSETTGCMRMEAGGSAQACRTEQVTAIGDQKAEFLLAQQLQRWGRDVLYEESLEVTAKILALRTA
ncbi:MAG TPA: glucose-6-phosphate dehydrogenase assembly protein OpcA [Synechococcales cyanobacterium M55_K2018_004]|nr:glucose-6-phosphate dehydrogenase assembly protein OpcA [Synechococcales cyanobacterium M55_K2018_004]